VDNDMFFEAESTEEANEIFYSKYFQCVICLCDLVKRTIIVTKDGSKTIELCENGHLREEK